MNIEYYLSGMYAGISIEGLHALIKHVCKDEEEADIVWHYVANLLQKQYLKGYSEGSKKNKK